MGFPLSATAQSGDVHRFNIHSLILTVAMRIFSLFLVLFVSTSAMVLPGCGSGGPNTVVAPAAPEPEMTEEEKKAFEAQKMKENQEFMKQSNN